MLLFGACVCGRVGKVEEGKEGGSQIEEKGREGGREMWGGGKRERENFSIVVVVFQLPKKSKSELELCCRVCICLHEVTFPSVIIEFYPDHYILESTLSAYYYTV